MIDKRLKDLAQITDLAYQAQAQKSQALLRQDAQIQSALVQITQAEQSRAMELRSASNLDAATRARADIHWQLWLERQKAQLNQKRTEIRLKLEEERHATALAFGRKTVAEKLAKKI
ncbi:hypothetical protein [Parasulfitobacter algicola]|uniref:Flagellar export protein FliJ n=1 Tax=Parasulfitobacter algicola TaxID=2614809 RepID=A0ABX2IUC5_9RHOB|nr:hypothetical protein [Sulfitobacter algicola]NSX54670.1 hypothetical protein [Sulfitobacter algicola]